MSQYKYLDYAGLQTLVDAIKSKFLPSESSIGSAEVNQIWAEIFNSPVNGMNAVEVEEVASRENEYVS